MGATKAHDSADEQIRAEAKAKPSDPSLSEKPSREEVLDAPAVDPASGETEKKRKHEGETAEEKAERKRKKEEKKAKKEARKSKGEA
jgi:H/ACA ribonucleoprotein complex subunit 4